MPELESHHTILVPHRAEDFADMASRLWAWCLLRTQDHDQAEELLSRISLEALKALSRNNPIHDFGPWVWGLARKQLAAWIGETMHDRERFDSEGDDVISRCAASDPDPLASLLGHESVDLLRRELGLLERRYRELVVPYYFQGKGMAELSLESGRPVGSIKRMLSETRELLKEGMEMERLQGIRSFDPDRMDWWHGGNNFHMGHKDECLKRRLSQNILLACARKPVALADLAIELGVAMPWLEDEVDILKTEYFIKEMPAHKGGGRCVAADFVIVDAALRVKMRKLNEGFMARWSSTLLEWGSLAADNLTDDPACISLAGQSRTELLWTVLPALAELLIHKAASGEPAHLPPLPQKFLNPWGIPDLRHNHGRIFRELPGSVFWELVAWESNEETEAFCGIGLDMNGSTMTQEDSSGKRTRQMHCSRWTFHGPGFEPMDDSMANQDTRFWLGLADLLRRGLEAGWAKIPHQESESMYMEQYRKLGLILEHGDKRMPGLLLFRECSLARVWEQLDHGQIESGLAELRAIREEGRRFLAAEVPPHLASRLDWVVGMFLTDQRDLLVGAALNQGLITLPAQGKRGTLGMWMEIY